MDCLEIKTLPDSQKECETTTQNIITKLPVNTKYYQRINLRWLPNLHCNNVTGSFIFDPECQIKILEGNLNFLNNEKAKSNNIKIRSYTSNNKSKMFPLPEIIHKNINNSEANLILKENEEFISKMKCQSPFQFSGETQLSESYNTVSSDDAETEAFRSSENALMKDIESTCKERFNSFKKEQQSFSVDEQEPHLKSTDTTEGKTENPPTDYWNAQNDVDNQFEFTIKEENIVSFVCSPSSPRKESLEPIECKNGSDTESENQTKSSSSKEYPWSETGSNLSSICCDKVENSLTDDNYIQLKQIPKVNEFLSQSLLPTTSNSHTSLTGRQSTIYCPSTSMSPQFKCINGLSNDEKLNHETILFREAAIRGCYNIENILNETKPPLSELEKELEGVKGLLFSAIRLKKSNGDMINDSVLSIFNILKSWVTLNSHFERKEFKDALDVQGVDLSILHDFLQWQSVSRLLIEKMIIALRKIASHNTQLSEKCKNMCHLEQKTLTSNTPKDFDKTKINFGFSYNNLVDELRMLQKSDNIPSPTQNTYWKQRRFPTEKIQKEPDNKSKRLLKSKFTISSSLNASTGAQFPNNSAGGAQFSNNTAGAQFFKNSIGGAQFSNITGGAQLSNNSIGGQFPNNSPPAQFPNMFKNEFHTYQNHKIPLSLDQISCGQIGQKPNNQKNQSNQIIENDLNFFQGNITTMQHSLINGAFNQNICISNPNANRLKPFFSFEGEMAFPINPHLNSASSNSTSTLFNIPVNHTPLHVQNFPIIPPNFVTQPCITRPTEIQHSIGNNLVKANPIYCADTDHCTNSNYIKPGSYNPPQKPANLQKVVNNSVVIDNSPVTGVHFHYSNPQTVPSSSSKTQTIKENNFVKKSEDTWQVSLTLADNIRENLLTDNAEGTSHFKQFKPPLSKARLLFDEVSCHSSSSDFQQDSGTEERSSFNDHTSKNCPSMVESEFKMNNWLCSLFRNTVDNSGKETEESLNINESTIPLTDHESLEGAKPNGDICHHNSYKISNSISSSHLKSTFNGLAHAMYLRADLNDPVVINNLHQNVEMKNELQKKVLRKNKKVKNDFVITTDQKSSQFLRKQKPTYKRIMTKQVSCKLQDISNCIWNTEFSSLLDDFESEKEVLRLELKIRRSVYFEAMKSNLTDHRYDTLEQALNDFELNFADIKSRNKEDKQCLEVVEALEKMFLELVEKHFGILQQQKPQFLGTSDVASTLRTRKQKKPSRRM